ncbi:Polynucleotide adenylyltransferase family protein isoform 2 [Hibiscus syriacus]|uniref:Polynucleotide adenylyltransferase family protein isoform 2 n=1 Tax=Hibiscus syriacus TaxID=106335 RepID=A0A6A3AYP9_HIBSY|nr:Polynucleotide adenylyltransferase family protein isoform 2 [Hibiscus syriacus]
MISGNQPVKAIDYICDLTLFWIVNLPPKVEPAVSEECYRLSAAYLDASWQLIQLNGCSNFDIHVVKYIFRDSLKRKASDADTVISIHKSLEKLLSLIPSLLSNEDVQITEVGWGEEFDVPILQNCGKDIIDKHFQLDKRKGIFESVENAIVKLGLEKVWDLKPLVNGKDIMNVLQLKVGGPLVREWVCNILNTGTKLKRRRNRRIKWSFARKIIKFGYILATRGSEGSKNKVSRVLFSSLLLCT